MEIEIKLYGLLRRHRPADQPGAPHHPFVLVCTPEDTPLMVIERLGIAEGMVVAAAINNQSSSLDTPLQPGDKLAFFPPSSGGS
ncbi:MAG: MoaD/ThiS family protein [Anaerolineae bacterium]|nr:MoaD/ThiS family protein [Anaerolineae bacterium]